MNEEILKLVESLPERYKKTAIRKISEGEKLQYNPEKGIVNEAGDIIIDINVCRDKVKDFFNDEIEHDLLNENSDEEFKVPEGNINENDDDEDDLNCENEKNIDEESIEDQDDNKEETKEELINTFKNKN